MANRYQLNLVISGDLADRLQQYLDESWSGQHVAAIVVRRALREFLDREGIPEKAPTVEGLCPGCKMPVALCICQRTE